MFKKKEATSNTDEVAEAKTEAKTKTSKPKKEKKEKPPKPEKSKNKKAANSNKIEQDKSQLAKDLGIRISSPYGYYPDDVDPIITKYREDVSSLTKENKQLSDELDKTKKNLKAITTELTQLKMQVSLMEVPPMSLEDGLNAISKIDNITGNNTPVAVGLLDDDVDESFSLEDDFKELEKKKPTIKLKGGKK